MPQAMAVTSFMNIPVMAICFFLIPKLAEKFGKRNVILGGTIYCIIAYIILILIPIPNVYVFMAFMQIASIGQVAFLILVWAIVTECIDYQEYTSHERADGTVYSIYTFSRKIGSAISSSGIAALLGMVGLVAGAQKQSAAFASNVRILTLVVPIFGAVIELIGIGLIFNINKEKSELINAELKKRYEQN